MSARKVHLRPRTVINEGVTKTYCGRAIYVPYQADLSPAVVSFVDFDATIHGALVTCKRCLARTRASCG